MQNAPEEALNPMGEEENIQTTPPVVEQEATEEVSQAEPTGEAQETETGESSNKGATARIRELNKKAKDAEARANSLAENLAALTGQVGPAEYQPYTPQVDPGAEISPEQYQQDVMRTADSLVTLRMKQADAINRINTEANEALRLYPQLDPDNESFDQELSDAVAESTEAYVKQNPYTASVKKHVEKLMKPYQRAVAKEVGKETENLARQVSESALRPTSIRKAEKSASEKSIAELEAELGMVNA